ncbi:MAG: hypothetical protein KF780_00500 [Sphingomonas sp.]|nr:hypothetical protein [Sphingomonas sp.]
MADAHFPTRPQSVMLRRDSGFGPGHGSLHRLLDPLPILESEHTGAPRQRRIGDKDPLRFHVTFVPVVPIVPLVPVGASSGFGSGRLSRRQRLRASARTFAFDDFGTRIARLKNCQASANIREHSRPPGQFLGLTFP